MCVLFSSSTFIWNISHSKKNWARYDQKCLLIFTYSSCYSCRIWIKLEISQQIFENFSNIKFHENPCSGSRVVPCGWTDGHDEAESRFFAILREASKKRRAYSKVSHRRATSKYHTVSIYIILRQNSILT